MTTVKKMAFFGFCFLLIYTLLLWTVWEKHQLLALACGLMAAAICFLGLFHPGPCEAVLPFEEDKHPSNRWIQVLAGSAGLYCAWMAAQAGFVGLFPPMALWLGLSALAWRTVVLEPLPDLRRSTRLILLLVLLLVGAFFRLYQAGKIPVGVAGRDEFEIWAVAWNYVDGLRATYGPASGQGADGIIPYYLMMAGLKLFGGSLLGYRMEGMLIGIALVLLFYRLAKDSFGLWVGLAAGFLWAVSLWPVTVTRANYFMAETLFCVVACMAMLAMALRRGGAWRFAAAGLLWAFCFNVYPAARIVLALVPWLYCLVWFLKRPAAPALGRSSSPLLLGFAVGIAPIVMWFATDPGAVGAYFSAFSAEQECGPLASTGLLGKINETLSRVFNAFPGNLTLLTQRGTLNPYYFPLQYPLIHPWLFTLAVLGAAVALAHFRNAFYSFLLYWWFVGFLPSVAAAFMSDRRAIMVLPPTLLLASVGVVTLARCAWALLGGKRVALVALSAAAVLGAAAYGTDSWHDYFDRNQRDPGLMMEGQAATTQMFSAVRAAVGPDGGVLISTWRPFNGSFFQPSSQDWWGSALGDEAVTMWRGIKVYWYQRSAPTFVGGGFVDALTWALNNSPPRAPGQAPADVYVLLVPFYDHLEPGLKAIGGEVVSEVRVPMSSKGPLAYTGIAKDPFVFARIIRLRGLDLAKIQQYSRRPQFKVVVKELNPPPGWSRDYVNMMNPQTQANHPLFASYWRDHSGWRSISTTSFTTDDPWFWSFEGLPGNPSPPCSLQIRARLSVQQDGSYAFGASVSAPTRIMVDGKKVFEWDPFDPARNIPDMSNRPDGGATWVADDLDRRGFLGRSLHLARGFHVIEIEEAMLSSSPFNNLVLRPIWSYSGHVAQTLPLESLSPLP